MKYACLFFMMVGACFALNGQQAGDLDASFNGGIKYQIPPHSISITAIAIKKDDHKIVLGGSTGTEYSVGRLSANGVRDFTFDSLVNPVAVVNGFFNFIRWPDDATPKVVTDLKILPDDYPLDRFTITGVFNLNGGKKGMIARIISGPGNGGAKEDPSLTNTDFDLNLNPATQVISSAIELLPNRGMQMAGGARFLGHDWDICLYRKTYDGSPDVDFNGGYDTFDLGGDEWATAMLFNGNQETFTTGSTTPHGGQADGFLAKFNGPIADTLWAPHGFRTFGRDGADTIKAMAWQSQDRILIAGSSAFDTLGRDEATIWRFNRNGLPDSTFGNNSVVILRRPQGERSRFEKILVQPDGKIIAIGWKEALHESQMLVARFDSTGQPDLSFGMPIDSGTVTHALLGPNSNTHALCAVLQVLHNQLYLVVGGDANSPQGKGFVTRLYLDYDVCAAAPVNITLTGDTMVCTYDCTTLSATATNAIDYQWESYQAHDSTRLVCSISEDETYSLTATSASGCTATDSITVHVSPVVPTIASNSPVCEGDTLRLNASGGLAYQWERPDGVLVANSELLFAATNGTESGLYQVTATDAIGCTGAVGQFVQINLPPSFSLQTPPTITSFENGQNAYISTNLQANTLLYWQLGNLANTTASPLWGQDSTSFFSIPISLVAENAPGTATVSLWASENNCFADTLIVPLSVWPLVNDTDGLFIPEIFTPNGDGANDEWVVSTNPNPLPNDLSVKIYNKQGVPVWVESPWDGRWDGANSPEGVYWYVIGNANNEAIAKGSLMLLRN